MANELDADELKLCNCARCGEELLGESMRPYLRRNSAIRLPAKYALHALPGGRHNGRPYCERCFHSSKTVQKLTPLDRFLRDSFNRRN